MIKTKTMMNNNSSGMTISHSTVISRCRFDITKGRHCFRGVDMGRAAQIIKEYPGAWTILKVPGHLTWGGVGMTRYQSTCFYLIHVKDGSVTDCYEGEFGRQYRQGILELEKVIELSKQKY